MKLLSRIHPGRGATLDIPNRFEQFHQDLDPDVVQDDPEAFFDGPAPSPKTLFIDDKSETIISKNESPDLGFSAGLNPYRGCEHGCSYCYARPYHEYLGFFAGLDFETKIMVKRRAPELLRAELADRRWQPQPLAMSGVTDCYQPAERHFRITRGCLEVLAEFRHPVGIITKNFLVTRDIDVLKELARYEAVRVTLSITTLDARLAAKMEPRASSPTHRLKAIQMLAKAGIPVGVSVAPVIPGLNEREIPAILEAARRAGATSAHYTLLRLPHGVKDIFQEWLRLHFPEKVDRVLDGVRAVRGGQLNVGKFGARMTGEGPIAEHINSLFHMFKERLGYGKSLPLQSAHFRRPGGTQLSLGLV